MYFSSIHGVADKKFKTLPESDLIKASKYRMKNDQNRFLLGRLILKSVFESKKNKIDSLNIQLSKYGKPFITGFLNFNISHSGEFVVLVLSKNDIGIDIELKEENNVLTDGAFFSAEEIIKLKNSNDVAIDFFTIWTKKEAIVKSIGIGLNSKLHQINTLDEVCHFNEIPYFSKEIKIHNDYICYIASDHPIEEVKITKLDFTQR